jgi:hypothetical protein
MTPGRLRSLAALLEEMNLPAMVIGGLAVAVHGLPRMTRDADVTVALELDQLQRALNAAQKTGFAARVSDPFKFAADTNVLPLQRTDDGWEVDIILAGSPYELEAISSAQQIVLGGVALPIISAQDLLIHKIIAGRPRDLDDAVSVVQRKREHLDIEFVRNFLFELAEAVADDDLRKRADNILR